MLAREVMSTPVLTLRPDDTVRHAADVLVHARIASAPVVDDDGTLVGIVSEADLLRGRSPADPRAHLRPVPLDDDDPEPGTGVCVADVMTPRPLSVPAGADAADAARLLLDLGIKAVPVTEGHRVVGVVARRDLLRSLCRPDDEVRDDVLRLLDGLGLAGDWHVAVVDGVVRLSGRGAAHGRQVAAVLARTVPGVVRVVQGQPTRSLQGRP
jgi:CBS-domain-containing membrane protein